MSPLFCAVKYFIILSVFCISCTSSWASTCDLSLQSFPYVSKGGVEFIGRTDVEEARQKVFKEFPDESSWESEFAGDLGVMRKYFSGFLQKPWNLRWDFEVQQVLTQADGAGVAVFHRADLAVVDWQAAAATTNYRRYIQLHELTHVMIARRLWELEPNFLEYNKWYETEGGIQLYFDLLDKDQKKEGQGSVDDTHLFDSVNWAEMKLFSLTRTSYEEIISDIAPLLVLGGAEDAFAQTIAELSALEKLSAGVMDFEAVDPSQFSAKARDMSNVLQPLEILEGTKLGPSEVVPHELIANARSQVWKKIRGLKDMFAPHQIMELLVQTLEREVTHQVENGFYLSSDRTEDLTHQQVREINERFVERFDQLVLKELAEDR